MIATEIPAGTGAERGRFLPEGDVITAQIDGLEAEKQGCSGPRVRTAHRVMKASWERKDAEYFDPVAREFRSADIEITGKYIGDIRLVGSSGLADGVHAAGFRCKRAYPTTY